LDSVFLPGGTVASSHFTAETLAFISDLKKNNRKPWFEKNKARYTEHMRDAALRFIEDIRPLLKEFAPRFRADARPVGGSLFRIYRDTRFSKDKSPYKTHLGIQFRHEAGKDVHAPGFYLHIEPGGSFVGLGLWRPDGKALAAIRGAIAEDPAAWKKAARSGRFSKRFRLEGESLKRPPRGFDADHPMVEDLKRKDFIGVCEVKDGSITKPGFLQEVAEACRDGAPFVEYLCRAIGLSY
jgi:uncharacterized protein (TIGR02453 family)